MIKNVLSKLNKFHFIVLGLIVTIGLVVFAWFSFDAYATREALESGLPKRGVVQLVSDEFENLLSKLVLGKPTPSAAKRDENKKETLKKLGKTKDLSSAGKQTKNKLLDHPVSKDGGDYLLKKTDNYYIEYVNFPDLFYVTIVNAPVEKYQKETEAWFINQGFSQNDLCGLGINFVINKDLRLKIGYPVSTHLVYCT